MLGFSLPKLIVLIVILVVVWNLFKWVNRINRVRAARDERERERLARSRPANGAEDMVRCPVCDTFVTARAARHCGRDDCPYPR
jgi:uncharacterized protein